MLNLISDSSCDLRAFELSGPQVRLQVIPMHLHIDHKDFPDDEDLNLREMLEAMAKAPSSTACPSPQAFADAFAQEKESICVTISSPLSGTYQAAVMTRDMFREEHPEAKLNIHIIDSRTYSMGYGMAVVEAARMARSGAAPEAIIAHIEDWVCPHESEMRQKVRPDLPCRRLCGGCHRPEASDYL